MYEDEVKRKEKEKIASKEKIEKLKKELETNKNLTKLEIMKNK